MLQLAKAIRSRWPEASCTFTAHDERAAEAIRKACGAESLQSYVEYE